ncbi:MAG: exodeoxyribonuclease V subunit beta [Janthinobacterium lividum]
MSHFEELDVFRCELDGVSLIEASAGTGKTWNICALYIRLLLEREVQVEHILVVTFTRAATAELHERIRGRLAQLNHALEARAVDADAEIDDVFIQQLFEIVIGTRLTQQDALRRIRRALWAFDQAAIHTIHGFCQRVLGEASFAANAPFDFEVGSDDQALRAAVATDFWRDRVEVVAQRDPSFAAWLITQGAGPASLDKHLLRRRTKPLARWRWGELDVDIDADVDASFADNDHAAALARSFEAASAMWSAQRSQIDALLQASLSSLHGGTYRADSLLTAFTDWDRHFRLREPHAAPGPKADLLATATLTRRVRKGQTPPAHPFFDLANALLDAHTAAEAANTLRWLSLIRAWIDWGDAELTRRKLAARLLSFDDLLANVHRALRAHPWLATAIVKQYPAALIDEFQDTDPLQFEIFHQVYAGGQAPLFLVGDPKQAIYAFRAADLHTYLRAREHARATYTLAVNQRSSPQMVESVNRIFMANPHPFILHGLDFRPVRAASGASRPALHERGVPAGTAGDDAPTASPALRVWTLPDGEPAQPLHKGAALPLAARASAAEIARLLAAARRGEVTLNDRASGRVLTGADIAVLVQTHRQGRLARQALGALGIASVELSQASVFATLDADNLERWLLAIETPTDTRRLRAALASDWLGADATTLWRLTGDGNAGEGADEAMHWIERLTRYRLVWHEHGFATMWRLFCQELTLPERLAAGVEGERRLTDISHLAELLQAQSPTGPTPALRWLAGQRTGTHADEAQLRLESDRDLVQIVTVHKSKGLEYPIVFCPFLFDAGVRPSSGGRLPDASEYRDESGYTVLHYGGDDAVIASARAQSVIEEAAERVRLIYVALTRAVHRCYLVAGLYATGNQGSTKESKQGVLNWLVAGTGDFETWLATPLEDQQVVEAWRGLSTSSLSVQSLPEPAEIDASAVLPPIPAHMSPQARVFRRSLPEPWRIASFSSMIASGSGLLTATVTDTDLPVADAGSSWNGAVLGERLVPDYDQRVIADLLDIPDPPEYSNEAQSPVASTLPATQTATDSARRIGELFPAADMPADSIDIFGFPRGAQAGECLHRLFELADFAAPDQFPAVAERALRERPIDLAADRQDAASVELSKTMLTRLLNDVVTAPMPFGGSLSDINSQRRLNELEFTFPATSARGLRSLLRANGMQEALFDEAAVAGYMKGFIDLVFEHGGRYWIVDWKSNHLGERRDDYMAGRLEQAMRRHGYRLQALIYSVALHRFLASRLDGYDYASHFGGCLYLFVRGVRPAWPGAGIHCERPSQDLLTSVDRVFGGVR